MTAPLTEADFCSRLAALGLTLDTRAFAAAFQGALRLRAQVARLDDWLVQPE